MKMLSKLFFYQIKIAQLVNELGCVPPNRLLVLEAIKENEAAVFKTITISEPSFSTQFFSSEKFKIECPECCKYK